MPMPTLDQLKEAPSNKEFFTPQACALFGDAKMEIGEMLWQGEVLKVLRITSQYDTKPIYKIEPGTLKLEFICHG